MLVKICEEGKAWNKMEANFQFKERGGVLPLGRATLNLDGGCELGCVLYVGCGPRPLSLKRSAPPRP